MALSEFESHHCNPSTSGFRDFCLIPTAQLCGASLGWRQRRGGSPWTRLSSLSPGLTLTMLTAFLPHLSAPANVPLPSQSLGNAHTPIPREDAGCWLGPGSGLPHGWLAFTAPVFLLPGHHTPHSAWAPSGHTGESSQ